MAPKRTSSEALGTTGFKTSSTDGQFLKKLLLSGKISKGCPPREILQSFPQFKKYKPESFRSGLRRLKTATGFNVREAAVIKNHAEEGKSGILYLLHEFLHLLHLTNSYFST